MDYTTRLNELATEFQEKISIAGYNLKFKELMPKSQKEIRQCAMEMAEIALKYQVIAIKSVFNKPDNDVVVEYYLKNNGYIKP